MNPRTAYLTYSGDNIGDDVQTLALCRILGPPDLFVNRDRFPRYADAGPIRLLANGFFTCGPFPPPPNIEVIYLALCASSLNGSDPATLEHLRASAPLGCRDRHTMQWCARRNIPHYFAGCPAILHERTTPYDPSGPMLMVNLDPALLPPGDEPVHALSYRCQPKALPTPEARLEAAQRRLEAYQRARLVITNRMHVAMPCLGMDVPVIMLEPDSLAFRLTALPDFVPIHKKEDLKRISLKPDDHRHDAAKWKAMVAERLRKRLGMPPAK